MKCQNCNYENPDYAKFCEKCGALFYVQTNISQNQLPQNSQNTYAPPEHVYSTPKAEVATPPKSHALTITLAIAIPVAIIAIAVCVFVAVGLFPHLSSSQTTQEETAVPVVQNEKLITEILTSQNNSVDTIDIVTLSKPQPNVFTLSNPDRIVLDFEGFALDFEDTYINKAGANFSNIRCGNHDTYARIVVDMTYESDYEVFVSDDMCSIKITRTGDKLN